MESSVEKDFIEVYNPVFKQFIDSIKEVNCENIEEPYIPAWGSEYENWEYKLAFVGMDANNQWGMSNGGLNRWVKYFPLNSESKKREFFDYNNNEIENSTIWEYGRKSIFLKFVKKFLDAFYNSPNSKKILNEEKILKSFVYGNVNSFVVPEHAPKGNEAWTQIKKASKIFDNAKHIIEAFKPKIIIRFYWDTNNDEYFNSCEGFWDSVETIAQNEIYYYFLKDTATHVFWTRHPMDMINLGPYFYIYSIIKDIYNRKIFPEFPGQHITLLIANIEKTISEIGEQSECDYEPFFRINKFLRIYFNPYQVFSEKIFKIKLLIVKDKLEDWDLKKIEFKKRYPNIDWTAPEKTGGWFIVGSKTYKNINDVDILQFQDYLKTIYYSDWKDIVNELKK